MPLAAVVENQIHASEDHHEHDEGGHEHSHLVERMDLLLIGFVGLCIVLSWSKVWTTYTSFDFFALVGTLVGGFPIFREAFANLIARRMTMELSMTIALVAALAIGEVFTAAVITVFVLVAEVLEGLTVGRGRQAIKDLLDLLPNLTFVQDESCERQVKTNELRVDDMLGYIFKLHTSLSINIACSRLIHGDSARINTCDGCRCNLYSVPVFLTTNIEHRREQTAGNQSIEISYIQTRRPGPAGFHN